MGKKFRSGVCIHCGEHFDDLTSDHVLPEAWYLDASTDIEKWQAPSCKACNARLGTVERRLLQKLALGTHPETDGTESVSEKALRSFDPRVANNDRDREHREKARDKVARELREVSELPDETLLPNLGPIHKSEDGYAITEVSKGDIVALVGKFVRGITFLRSDRALPKEYVVRVFRLSEIRKLFPEWLATNKEIFEFAGFRVERHPVPDDEFIALFRIFLWHRFQFAAVVAKREWPAKGPVV